MRLVPESLAGRLLVFAAGALTVALIAAAAATGFIIERFVTGQIDGRLDMQIEALAEALDAGPQAFAGRTASLNAPPFDRARSGWVWTIRTPEGTLQSASLAGQTPPRIPKPPHGGPFERAGRPYPGDGRAVGGVAVHWRVQPVSGPKGDILIAVAAPRAAITGPLTEALWPLALALACIGLALLGAAVVQVRLGLRPLGRLRQELGEVRTGRRAAIGADQPLEVRPLVEEINSLLAENAEGLTRARLHVANLAHGLNTPLARLGAGLAARGDGEAAAQVDTMDRLIRHHLSRARSAALRGATRTRADPVSKLHDLAGVMRAVHADRRLLIDVDVTDTAEIACEDQDFDEILGNLIDNACKWAVSRVDIKVERRDGEIAISVADDGPGIAPDAMSGALMPGQRIDEAAPGFGFGLSIAKELTALYGGSLELRRSVRGGLLAEVRLPEAR